MNKVKMENSRSLLTRQMKNKAFVVEYQKLEDEFVLAKEVIRLRLEANLTQTQLAKLASTSQPAIARLESGAYKNLTLSFLRKIGKALNAYPLIHMQKMA